MARHPKKILIFGPIGDFGGRDVEVNIIARSLAENHDLQIFSTRYISRDSPALQGLENVGFSSVHLGIFEKYPLIRFFSYLKYFADGRKQEVYAYIKNRLMLKLYNWRALKLKIIKSEISKADLVFACVQPTSQYLTEAIEFAKKKNIPFLVRTTGTIPEMDKNAIGFLADATLYIHHSEKNAALLNRQIAVPHTVIDQCALSEKQLLSLPFQADGPIVFGYAGRLSKEKGILPLIDFFVSHPEYQLVVAGSGQLEAAISKKIAASSNIRLLGQLKPSAIGDFFARVQCLVIPSFEESGPLVGLEAMAAGRIVISTRVGAMESRLAGTGNNFWLEIGSLDGLEESLAAISGMTLEELEALSAKLRQKYIDHYTVAAIEQQYRTLVGQIFETRQN